jgi:acetyltransferase-like isoleucine patch superfamily enzyme
MFRYLWLNRERPRIGSTRWCRAYAKRIVTMPSLITSEWRQRCLRSRGAKIEPGVFIAPCRFSYMPSNLAIGKNTFIGRAVIYLYDRVDIGCNVVINDGAVLITGWHDLADEHWRPISKPILIKSYAVIMTGTLIMPGVTIGYGAAIGAGAVVTKDVPDLALAVGNPSRIIENVRPRNLSYNPAGFVAAFRAWVGDPAAEDSI